MCPLQWVKRINTGRQVLGGLSILIAGVQAWNYVGSTQGSQRQQRFLNPKALCPLCQKNTRDK